MANMAGAYAIIDAPTTLVEKDITKAYRRMCLKQHPDKPGGTKEGFQMLIHSYEKLKEHLQK